jgi:ATP-dependent HslUV protease ATP-binding subunit HslU
VGRDVDTIIRDLMDAAVKLVRDQAKRRMEQRALDAAEDRILDALLPGAKPREGAVFGFQTEDVPAAPRDSVESATRQKFRKRLREGELDDKEIDIDVAAGPAQLDVMTPPGMEDFAQQLQGMFAAVGAGKKKSRRMRIADALKQLADEEAGRLVNEDEIRSQALAAVEGNGIVFIDEIGRSSRKGCRAPTSACSATCCRWSRALRSTPATARCAPITSCSSPRAPSTCPARRT